MNFLDGQEVEVSQQQDWSIVWACFDNPYQLLSLSDNNQSKGMLDMVRNAVFEMRRYYSRKIVDVLIKVTKSSLDSVRRRFSREVDEGYL